MFIVPLALMGCSAWIDQEPACGQDVYYWSDDLLAFVLTGDGSGSFDFDPDDTPRTGISGSYDPATGDFSYTTDYDAEYYYRKAETTGFGTVYHNGNLDLLYTTIITDMLGDSLKTTYRVQRDGCDMTVASWDPDEGDIDSALAETGPYDDDTVWSWTAAVSGAEYQGSLRQNLTRTAQYQANDGSYWSFTSSKPEGVVDQEWSGDCSGYYCEGTSTRNFDGTLDSEYTAYDGTSADDDVYAAFTGSYDYDGSGTETGVFHIDGDTITCDYVTDADGDCSYECDSGEEGDC